MTFHGRLVFAVVCSELHRCIYLNADIKIVHAVAGNRKPRTVFAEVLSVDFEASLLNVDLYGFQLMRHKKFFQFSHFLLFFVLLYPVPKDFTDKAC